MSDKPYDQTQHEHEHEHEELPEGEPPLAMTDDPADTEPGHGEESGGELPDEIPDPEGG